MSRERKMKTTRPEFLLSLMAGGDIGSLTMGNMSKHLTDFNHISYCVYTALMKADIDQSDILATYDDGESIAITMRSKRIAKETKNECQDMIVRYGSKKYAVKFRVRDNNLIGEVAPVEE